MILGQCHAEEIYVRVETGERFFGLDYIRNGNTPMDLFSELAHGTVVHEDEWLKNYPPEAEPNLEIRKARIEAAAEAAAELRHHKLKRCLIMAEYCEAAKNQLPFFGAISPKEEWFDKWHDRWLELAEKFKPNSTAQ